MACPRGLTDWINQYGPSFVTHAIYNDNVVRALENGVIESSEEQLRKLKTVSYEKGGTYGARGSTNISIIAKHLGNKKEKLPQCIEIVSNAMCSFKQIARDLDLTDDEVDEVEHYYKIPSKDLPEVTIINKKFTLKKIDGEKVFIRTSPEVVSHMFGIGFNDKSDGEKIKYQHELDALCYLFKCLENSIQIANDSLLENPIDKRLAQVWNAKRKEGGDNRKLFLELINFRALEIYKNCVLDQVRVTYQKINWTYGDVIVLRGNCEKILSTLCKCDSDTNKNKQESEIQFFKGQELYLLHPIENNGDFFALDMTQEDTIIIGPKKELASHVTNRMKVFCIEDMNQEELDFFQVPPRLLSQHSTASSVVALLSKSPVFNPKTAKKDAMQKPNLQEAPNPNWF